MSQPPSASDQLQLQAAATQLAKAVNDANADPTNAAKQHTLREAQAAAAGAALVVATHTATTADEKANLASLNAQYQQMQQAAQNSLLGIPNAAPASTTSSVVDAVKKHGSSFLETLKKKHHGVPTYGWVIIGSVAVGGAVVAAKHFLKHRR